MKKKNKIKKDFELTNEYMTEFALRSCVSFMELNYAFAQLTKELGKFLKKHPEYFLSPFCNQMFE